MHLSGSIFGFYAYLNYASEREEQNSIRMIVVAQRVGVCSEDVPFCDAEYSTGTRHSSKMS